MTQCHEQLPPVASAPSRAVARRVPRAAGRTARGGRGRRRRGGGRGHRVGEGLPPARTRLRAAAARGRPRGRRARDRYRPATRRSSGLAGRRTPYASGSMRTRRSTPLGFQPPAIGEEEIAAVAETLRSGWLTTGPRAALLEERVAAYRRGRARPRRQLRHGRDAPLAARARRRAGRRGHHVADHMARDGERDRALRRDARLLRRARGAT